MSASEIEAARMTKVSYINLTEGRLAALAYTKEHLPSYELITKDGILTEHGALFKNKNTNELRLAYRGTQTGVDWKTNFRLASMLEEGGMQISKANELCVVMPYVHTHHHLVFTRGWGTGGRAPPARSRTLRLRRSGADISKSARQK